MKFIIRSGKVKGEGARYPGTRTVRTWNTRAEAEAHGHIQSAFQEWRIVHLLSHEESKAKAKAGFLRTMTANMPNTAVWSAAELRWLADELWPAKGERPGADERDLREAEEKRRRRAERRIGEERKRR